MKFQDVVAVWRMLRTGTFVTFFEPELAEDQRRYIAVDRQVLDSGWPVVGPLCCHDFYSSDFHQVTRFIISGCLVHTDGA